MKEVVYQPSGLLAKIIAGEYLAYSLKRYYDKHKEELL